MHEYYRKSADKIRKTNEKLFRPIRSELEQITGKDYAAVEREIWELYESELLERFPYIGGDEVSGTGNLTGSYAYVAMGEVLKRYGTDLREIGHLMALGYGRKAAAMPAPVKFIMRKLFTNKKLLNKMFRKKDKQNAENAEKNPGSFETKTQEVPAEGCIFTYKNLVCPLADFAKKYGYSEYMPYICNLDYAMYGELGVPLYRTRTCAEDGDCCDFSLKADAPCMEYWPPVFEQGTGYK